MNIMSLWLIVMGVLLIAAGAPIGWVLVIAGVATIALTQ